MQSPPAPRPQHTVGTILSLRATLLLADSRAVWPQKYERFSRPSCFFPGRRAGIMHPRRIRAFYRDVFDVELFLLAKIDGYSVGICEVESRSIGAGVGVIGVASGGRRSTFVVNVVVYRDAKAVQAIET